MFHTLTLADVRRETADCVSLAFAVPPTLRDVFVFAPGQYLTLRARIDGEDMGVEPRLLDAHLARCASCRAFDAALTGSRSQAVKALALHPLVPSVTVAQRILEGYLHGQPDLREIFG